MNKLTYRAKIRIRRIILDNLSNIDQHMQPLRCQKCHCNLCISRLKKIHLTTTSYHLESNLQYLGSIETNHFCLLCNYNLEQSWSLKIRKQNLILTTFLFAANNFRCYIELPLSKSDIQTLGLGDQQNATLVSLVK